MYMYLRMLGYEGSSSISTPSIEEQQYRVPKDGEGTAAAPLRNRERDGAQTLICERQVMEDVKQHNSQDILMEKVQCTQ